MTRGFEIPGAWGDETHSIPSPPEKPAFTMEGGWNADLSYDVDPGAMQELIREHNRMLLAKWEEMLGTLPEPPAGMAWYPEWGDAEVDFTDNTATWSLRPVLRRA